MMRNHNRNERSQIGSGSIGCVLLFGIVLLTLVVFPVTAAKLATPTLVSPPNNVHFFQDPEQFTLSWKPVPNAQYYFLELSYKADSHSDWSAPGRYPNTTNTFATYISGSNYTYRWRITAIDSGDNYSKPSSWRTFDFISVRTMQLAKPVLISPTTATNFYQTVRDTEMVWKPVPGANSYSIRIYYYNPGSKTWSLSKEDTIFGAKNSSYMYTCPLAGQYKWDVKAEDSSPLGWVASKLSTSSTFTHKL